MVNYKRKAIIGTFGLAVILTLGACGATGFVMLRSQLCEIRGYTDMQLSMFFSIYCAGTMVGNLFVSKLIAKLGVKKLVLIGALGPFVGFTSLAFVSNIYILWIMGLIFGILVTVASFVTNGIFVSSWFDEGRGTMMSVSGVILNLVMIVAAPAMAAMVTNWGAVKASFALGIFLSGISVVCALFLVCELPAAYGVGAVNLAGKSKKTDAATKEYKDAAESKVYEPVMPVTKLLLMPKTLMCILVPVLLSAALTMYSTNSVQVLQSFGLDYMQASFFLSFTSIVGIVVVSLFGVLNDKIGPKTDMMVFTFLACVAMFVSFALDGMAGAVLLSVFVYFAQFSNMYGGLVMPEIYGSKKAPELMGYSGTLMGLAGVAAPPIATGIYTITGSWKMILPVQGVIYIIVMVFIMAVMSENTKKAIKEKDSLYIQSINESNVKMDK